jgi:hypothetical protein
MLVSESYVLLNYEKKVYMLFTNKIYLNQNHMKKNSRPSLPQFSVLSLFIYHHYY